MLAVLVLIGGGALLGAPPSTAAPIVGGGDPVPVASPYTELQIGPITGALGVLNVGAYDAPTTYDPVEDGYPTTIPGDWPAQTIAYAGSIPAVDGSGRTVFTYCIDLFTETETGVTYERGEWNEANVRNLGYVAYILQNYYPSNPAPAGVPDNVRSAAVQSAIWFFSDNLVLNPSTRLSLFSLTSSIVADALANGPVTEPEQPSLSVSPESGIVPSTGELVGPFTVEGDGPATLQLDGVEVFADAEGTQPLAEGASVAPGSRLWVRSASTASSQGFSLRREQLVRESTVYL